MFQEMLSSKSNWFRNLWAGQTNLILLRKYFLDGIWLAVHLHVHTWQQVTNIKLDRTKYRWDKLTNDWNETWEQISDHSSFWTPLIQFFFFFIHSIDLLVHYIYKLFFSLVNLYLDLIWNCGNNNWQMNKMRHKKEQLSNSSFLSRFASTYHLKISAVFCIRLN